MYTIIVKKYKSRRKKKKGTIGVRLIFVEADFDAGKINFSRRQRLRNNCSLPCRWEAATIFIRLQVSKIRLSYYNKVTNTIHLN